MRKCHLHKCQTSLGQVHKLVTHPSKISLHNLLAPFNNPLAPFNNPLGIHRKWSGGPWEENSCWVFFPCQTAGDFFGREGGNFFPLLPEPLPQIIKGSSLRPLPQPISHLNKPFAIRAMLSHTHWNAPWWSPYIPMGMWWHCSNGTSFINLVKSFTDHPWWPNPYLFNLNW